VGDNHADADGRDRVHMPADVTEQVIAAAAARLPDVVRRALGAPGAVLGDWQATPLHGGFGALRGESWVGRFTGTAHLGPSERPWSVVLKVLTPADQGGQSDPTHIRYWKREMLLYGSGILDNLPPGIRAPRCHGSDGAPDGLAWIWLEDVAEDGPARWPLARWALAAQHLGQFNGAYGAGLPLPRAPWLGANRLSSWLVRHDQLVVQIAAAPLNPELRHYWPRPVVDDILRLWAERDAWCARLERLPRTFGHGDAIRRNLIAHRAADGSEQTVAIDWAFAGYYALGEEVGQTLSVASAFFHVEPDDLSALDEALFAGYLAGLADAGWRGDPRPVRLAYCAHAALRNLFNAVGASLPDPARRAAGLVSQGRSWEELAERRAAIRPFLLERAAEARQLLAVL
jgi:hypothetical protein